MKFRKFNSCCKLSYAILKLKSLSFHSIKSLSLPILLTEVAVIVISINDVDVNTLIPGGNKISYVLKQTKGHKYLNKPATFSCRFA